MSLPSSLGILSYRDYVHEIFEIFHDTKKPESGSDSLSSLSFKPIRSTIDDKAIVRFIIQEFELSSPVIPGPIKSQAKSQVCHSAHNFANLSLTSLSTKLRCNGSVLDTSSVTRKMQVHGLIIASTIFCTNYT